MVPPNDGGWRRGELAVEDGILVLQHHLVLGRDEGPWEALIWG